MTPDLTAALAHVDRVFSGFTCRPDNVCLHCYALDDVAPLAVAGAELGTATLASLMFRSPFSVDDHAALVRRLLAQMAHGMADGSIEITWPAHHCLARGDWREWPDRQSLAVRRFVEAWWFDQVTTPGHEAPFDAYAAILGDLPSALASWPEHPVADRYLVGVSEGWIDELMVDCNPLWVSDDADDSEACAVLRDWYIGTAAERLVRAGATELAGAARLLALPMDERMRRFYGASPTT